MARKRHSDEEAIYSECTQNIQRIGHREASMHSCIAEVDEKSYEQEQNQSVDSRKGMEELAQMNTDLEQLIRSVYSKIQSEQRQ